MLDTIFNRFNFKKSTKSGIFIDFFFKKISLNFLKIQFNWVSLFILEKFFIEFLSRYIFNKLNFNNSGSNKFDSFNFSVVVYTLVVLFLL